MARIKFPYLAIMKTRNNLNDGKELIQAYNEARSYKRVDGKFIPIGWYIQWSDGFEEVILDIDLL